MKLFNEIHKLINALQKKILKKINIEKNQTIHYPYSDELQKKLGLLIDNINNIDQKDLKKVMYRKIETKKNQKLLISYRLDFYSKDELNAFKKKYNSFIL